MGYFLFFLFLTVVNGTMITINYNLEHITVTNLVAFFSSTLGLGAAIQLVWQPLRQGE